MGSSPLPPKTTAAQRVQVDRLRMPGMIPQEVVIFKAWYALHSSEFTAEDFNVRVGEGFDPGPTWPATDRTAAVMNSQKRIDALLWQGQAPTIVEVKVRAEPWIIGQILAYSLLFKRQYTDFAAPKLLILCFQTDPDTVYCCQQLGIEIQTVPADFSVINKPAPPQ